MRRFIAGATALVAAFVVSTQPAAACAGLIGPNGAVNLLRTTTFAGYHNGVEHYVTSFQFAGGSGQFGSLIPLPGIPDKVEKGGAWTLQRLIRETNPIPVAAAFSALAAVFDADAAKARGQKIGDGTPVHVTIPTANPWVPLRILGLGKSAADRVDADVYLLTDQRPALLPYPFANGMRLDHSATATTSLLNDLRSDKGMDWIPQSGWLTKVAIDASASQLTYDLAVDTKGTSPSRVAAGLEAPATVTSSSSQPSSDQIALIGMALTALGALVIL